MRARLAALEDVEECAKLRAALWPRFTVAEHRSELIEVLGSGAREKAVFVVQDADRRILGFAESAVRHDYVNGCATSPVAFLEGIFVLPKFRGRGIGKALCSVVEAWGRSAGCSELASDAGMESEQARAFHSGAGFEETERVVFFRKPLNAS